ncbi:MAG TPA: hypothetical protein PKZ84_09150 [Anaerolineae bacterium]|mgnify:FL=1|nr:hypothetical protein [Anaerolineae bacterium]HQI84636.1 hypothetical protein [Anaerolineae bacterium]
MSVEFETLTLPAPAEVRIEFSLSTQVNVTDFTAQRKVSKVLLDQVGNLLYGERPTLVAGRRLLWRVPVWVALPTTGPLGQVGTLDVDAQTGEVLTSTALLNDIEERAHVLVERTTLQAK